MYDTAVFFKKTLSFTTSRQLSRKLSKTCWVCRVLKFGFFTSASPPSQSGSLDVNKVLRCIGWAIKSKKIWKYRQLLKLYNVLLKQTLWKVKLTCTHLHSTCLSLWKSENSMKFNEFSYPSVCANQIIHKCVTGTFTVKPPGSLSTITSVYWNNLEPMNLMFTWKSDSCKISTMHIPWFVLRGAIACYQVFVINWCYRSVLTIHNA